MLFSKRKQISDRAVQWCEDKQIPVTPLNILAALDDLGYLRSFPTKTAWLDPANFPIIVSENGNDYAYYPRHAEPE